MSATFDISEVRDLERDIAATADRVDREAPEVTSKVAREVFDKAKAAAPVETGELAGSIYMRSEDGGKAVRIGSDLKQGFFTEFGTSKMSPRPWLYPAEGDVPRRMTDLLAKLGGHLGGR